VLASSPPKHFSKSWTILKTIDREFIPLICAYSNAKKGKEGAALHQGNFALQQLSTTGTD
jgi:hypothetical protein